MRRTYRLLPFLILMLLLMPACNFVELAAKQVSEPVAVPSAGAETMTPQLETPSTTAVPAPVRPEVVNPGAPEVANYVISVRLDADAHLLTGEQTITYTNTAQEPFSDLVFHLYLNAFKNEDSVFMRESGGQLRGYAFNPQSAGWIEVTELSLVEGAPLKLQLLEDGTLASARLPEPVASGESVSIHMRFRAQLPEIFARTGWVLDARGDPFFLVGQWFPKLGVWSDEGWIADVFHGNAEFFADFGRYHVELTLPEDYVHGGTGLVTEMRQNADGTQTVVYEVAGVIDFVWAASPNFKEARRQVGEVELVYLYLPDHVWSVERILDDAQSALEVFSEWFGAYPYTRLTISDVPEEGSGAGGMEYPTFITVGVSDEDRSTPVEASWTDFPEIVTVHEMAHQWWQSMVATNEAREPWLDEGFADYSTARYFAQQYGMEFSGPEKERLAPGLLAGRRASFLRNPDLPVYGTAWDMPYNEYVIAAYSKPVMSLMTLEGQIGAETMQKILQTYFERYSFAHPTTRDFQAVAVEVSGQDLDWFFDDLVYGDETLNWRVKSMAGDTITIVREGEIELPAEVQVTLAKGQQEMATCAADQPVCTLEFTGQEVEAVTVDPDRKLMIETNWVDNRLP